jgi:hypothetical protein
MFFKPTSPQKIVAQQRYEAERLRLEHAAAAEAHQAAAGSHKVMEAMYLARVQRLDALQATEDAAKEF